MRCAVKMSGMNNPVSTEISEITDALSLWRMLVRGSAGRALLPAVAVDAFRRIHRDGAPGAFDSALLLSTDWRWYSVSANVIAGIVDSGILSDDDQDRLADELLWHQQVRYRHPLWWTGATFIEFELGSPGPGRTPGSEHPGDCAPLRVAAAAGLGGQPRPRATSSVSRRRPRTRAVAAGARCGRGRDRRRARSR
jgi:hypothetical protein